MKLWCLKKDECTTFIYYVKVMMRLWQKYFKHKPHFDFTGRFIVSFVITNICNKKTKGPTLMELFTATRK